MRVQLQGQHLRMRLQEAELKSLLEGATVDNRTRWPDGGMTLQQVRLGQALAWQPTAGGWCIVLPAPDLRRHADSLPSRAGLAYALETPHGPLDLRVDVDVRDSTRQRMPRRRHRDP